MSADVLDRLVADELVVRGFLANASNHTLLVHVGDPVDEVLAVYKPRAGERPLWDFPSGTLCQREVAAYAVSELLGWGLVPPTVLRDGPMGAGSVQLFVHHDPACHYFMLVDDPAHHAALARIAFFDLLSNNADRKATHVLPAGDGRILACDHGLTFHHEPKLRTVIWDLGGFALPASWRSDMARLAAEIEAGGGLVEHLCELLSPAESAALRQRATQLAELQALPLIREQGRPYPWPLL
jgi:uncharacterized repeat protein (TIGR03843 family)